jgi:isochorismate synthase
MTSAPGPATAPAAAHGSLAELLAAAAARAPRDAELVGVALRAPLVPAETLLALPFDQALLFAPPAGFESSGLGAAATLTAAGSERYAILRAKADELFARVAVVSGNTEPPRPRLFGGFAFQTGRAATELWQPFGEARFVLPRLLYTREGNEASLTVFAPRAELARHAAEAERALSGLGRSALPGPAQSVSPSSPPSAAAPSPEELEWCALVDAICAAIESGDFEKVVLARCVELTLANKPDLVAVLQRLRAQAPESTRFVLSQAGASFLGATPERLIRKHGSAFESEAVAGSMKAGDATASSRLLESEKDLLEHAVVVRDIVTALRPLVGELEHPRRPELHRLKHVLHLRTPIRGRLDAGRHVLSLVERLHPTPAVGGVPTQAALTWIERHERHERGWYAGPFGWFDAAGDGEFVVALRSGVLRGEQAHLYVGAGIVHGSSPHEEFAETQWKLAALAGALGVGS